MRLILLKPVQEQHRANSSGLAQVQFHLLASLFIASVKVSTPIQSHLSHSFEVFVNPDLNYNALTLIECISISKLRVQPRLHIFRRELCLRAGRFVLLHNVSPPVGICGRDFAAINQHRAIYQEGVTQENRSLHRRR